ncbi:MAG: hypothetical protein NXY57DRAFT_1040015 [Lentinula lateritia]|uniref:Lysine decarboxylase n=1 Tax=Lentinula lateritia TaxID=40482 RepID=A0ABQ8VP10_9AGAR|nr:MAG: hypothetical protein NXY57DRAFT_1040015 [Lentinula lateritia]KAJ4498016.1 hypothetical protein C8R41DRAFT_917034 [Lentinula lateritia]
MSVALTTQSGPLAPASVCVYCAASPGNIPAHRAAAVSVGAALARAGRTLIYGGSSKGLMGIVSSSCLNAGGDVTGIIPYAMAATGGEGTGDGFEQKGKLKTIIVKSMHERKMKMAILAEGGFVALPGGYGTLEEIFEVTTWSQLGIHSKPVILLNVEGYFNPLRMFIQDAVAAGYIRQQYVELITFVDAPSDCSQESFDWGLAMLQSLSTWNSAKEGLFQWARTKL